MVHFDALVSAQVSKPQVAGSKPVWDDQGYELFGEISPKNRRFFILCTFSGRFSPALNAKLSQFTKCLNY